MGIEIPLEQELAEELTGFWADIFGAPLDVSRDLLVGRETEYNLHTLYLARRNHKLAGTCLLTISKSAPTLGGFGEVATSPALRRTGIATDLCAQAVEDFRASGGQALFLGTVNADAARVYHRLGWRRLAGSLVMANITGGDSPEEFLVDYFRGKGTFYPPARPRMVSGGHPQTPIREDSALSGLSHIKRLSTELHKGGATIRMASPAVRIPMIPLIHTPHDWQVLDANAGIYSRRYSEPGGCMSLYRKYEAVAQEGRGAWFAAFGDRGHVVGLSTVCLDKRGDCQVDGFAHQRFIDSWEELMAAAISWGTSNGAARLQATVSVEDEEKQTLLEGLGFRKSGVGEEFEVGGRAVASVRMERAAR